jgi:RNA polymerase sigma-70 factor (ECF subfamily)
LTEPLSQPAQLLMAVAHGDAAALDRLYDTTCAKLYGVVLRIVRRHDLAGDVMVESYLQVWQRAGEFDPAHGSPLAWMVAIARRLAIDVAHRTGAGADEAEIIGQTETAGSMPRHQLTDGLKRLLTCIGRLEPECQRMLLLAYYGAFSRDELCARLGMPMDALKASLRRSLVEVEQCLTT